MMDLIKLKALLNGVCSMTPQFEYSEVLDFHLRWYTEEDSRRYNSLSKAIGNLNSHKEFAWDHSNAFINGILEGFISKQPIVDKHGDHLIYDILVPEYTNNQYHSKLLGCVLAGTVTIPCSNTNSSKMKYLPHEAFFSKKSYVIDNYGYLKTPIKSKKHSVDDTNGKAIKYKLYSILDNLDLSVLKELHRNGLHANIVMVRLQSTYMREKGKTLLNDITVPGSRIEYVGNDERYNKISKVMKTMLSEHSIDESTWNVKLLNVISSNYVRVNFRLNSSTSNALKTLIGEFNKNDVIPIRFNWDNANGRRENIIGGIVVCPIDSLNVLSNKLKLFGVKYFKVTHEYEILLREIEKMN